MNPSRLRPGDQVRRRGDPNAPVFVYLDHYRNLSRCKCDLYKGLNGPDDLGHVVVSDWEMSRNYERIKRATSATESLT